MNKSIYGDFNSTAGATPSIYGYGTTFSCLCDCQPTTNPLIALENLLNILKGFLVSLSNYKTRDNINAPLVTKVGVRGVISFKVYSRILWAQLHPGKVFDITSVTDINAIKDIYLSYNQDWRTDKILMTLSGPGASGG